MFDFPKDSEFTQGTVFSCAYAENYLIDLVYGLVITARCDAAQEKVPVFSYVPVVPLTAWICVDGAQITLDRIEADLLNTAKSLLKANLLSDSLLKTHSLEAIYDAHFREHEKDRKKQTHCEKMQILIKKHTEVLALRSDLHDRNRLVKCFDVHSGIVEGLIKELSGNRLMGYYLLSNLETLSEQSDQLHIALLREVHHIPFSMAKNIASGMVAPMGSVARGTEAKCPRFTNDGDVAMPLGRLRSPWIEHLMQNFSLLFSRIGIPDADLNAVRMSMRSLGIGA